MKHITYTYATVKDRFRNEWKIFLLAFLFILIADSIGQIKIPVLKGTFIIFPIFYSLFLGILSGPSVMKILKSEQVEAASKLTIVAILPFIAKLGINAGASIRVIWQSGLAIVLQEIGDLGTIFFALPVAVLLGLKREAIGASHSINRETNLALIQDVYGPKSPEARGSLSVYIIGGMVGTIYFGFMVSLYASTGVFHPYALAMACGVGAGIMMASGTASLVEIFPAYATEIGALASASETFSGVIAIYVALFVSLPLCNWLYSKLEPTLGRVTKAGRQAAAELAAQQKGEN